MTISACYSLLLCLNLFYVVSLFAYIVFRWGGHLPPEETGAHGLRRCVKLLEVFILKC